jgi:hypothetical protein
MTKVRDEAKHSIDLGMRNTIRKQLRHFYHIKKLVCQKRVVGVGQAPASHKLKTIKVSTGLNYNQIPNLQIYLKIEIKWFSLGPFILRRSLLFKEHSNDALDMLHLTLNL